MSKKRFFLCAVALVAVMAWSLTALAAEDAKPAAPAEKAAPAAKPATPAPPAAPAAKPEKPAAKPAEPAAKPAEAAAKPAAPAEKAAPAAPKPKPKTEVKCEVTGKLTEKTAKNKQGKEVKVFELAVAGAKNADGKPMDKLKGKTVRVAQKKGLKLADHVGKDVTINGTLINNRRLVVDTIK